MKIYELVIDENAEVHGIRAISLVESPAIEEDFIALNAHQEVRLAMSDRRVVMGPALIPDKPILRRDTDGSGYYIYFSKATIRRLQELFFKNANHHAATLQHETPVEGTYIAESWIIENPEMDKAKHYGFDLPTGTWMVGMKIENSELWEREIVEGRVKGFSIEGHFADAAKLSAREGCGDRYEAQQIADMLQQIEGVCKDLHAN
jgi:hypothetical protein